MIDLVDALECRSAVVRATQIQEHEVVGSAGRELGMVAIDAANVVAPRHEVVHEMVADEAAGPGDEYARRSRSRRAIPVVH